MSGTEIRGPLDADGIIIVCVAMLFFDGGTDRAVGSRREKEKQKESNKGLGTVKGRDGMAGPRVRGDAWRYRRSLKFGLASVHRMCPTESVFMPVSIRREYEREEKPQQCRAHNRFLGLPIQRCPFNTSQTPQNHRLSLRCLVVKKGRTALLNLNREVHATEQKLARNRTGRGMARARPEKASSSCRRKVFWAIHKAAPSVSNLFCDASRQLQRMRSRLDHVRSTEGSSMQPCPRCALKTAAASQKYSAGCLRGKGILFFSHPKSVSRE